jgi:TRAP-type C4-dicarboxylate transport system permease small subunit
MDSLGKAMDTLLGAIAGILLFAMMTLTFVDVVLRYLFSAPLRGSFEITELMMVTLVFAGLPLVSRRDEHVVMDFLDHLMPPALYRAVRRLVHAVCALVLGGMGSLIWQKASKLHAYGDTTAVLRVELAPYAHVMAALIFVTALIHLYMAFARRVEAD